MKVYQQRVANLKDGMRRLYNVVYGQCSPAMIDDPEADCHHRRIHRRHRSEV
jgi:hypothetical protein